MRVQEGTLANTRRGLLIIGLLAVFGAVLIAPQTTLAALPKSCDPIAAVACGLPWPNNFYTRADASTDTGRRLALPPVVSPATNSGKRIDLTQTNRSDGFSPGTMIVARVPGLNNQRAFKRSKLTPINAPARYAAANAAAVVIDTVTGQRHPIFAEMDAQAASDSGRSLIVRPLKNFVEGRHYVVALRSLKDAAGKALQAPAAFRAVRDGKATGNSRLKARATQLAPVFATLAKAGIKRRDLYLAWDFSIASRRNLSERELSIRDRAFAELGDDNLGDLTVTGRSPSFTVTSVEDFPPEKSGPLARRIRGEFTVPCFLDKPGCPPGARFQFGPDGLPVRTPGNDMKAPFVCQTPRAAVGGAPFRKLRPLIYGHGLLGSRAEMVENVPLATSAQESGLITCATDWAGMSSSDLPTLASQVIPNLSNFSMLTDRVQQGFVNFMFLGRLMLHPDGFSSDPAFRSDNNGTAESVIDTQRLFYHGNSQGGILGGALTAVAPDFQRAALGVPGMNFSTLLDRSTAFDPFRKALYRNYELGPERPLVMALIQQQWDRAEANGYAAHMTDAPYPNTPSHKVLLLEAFGDHQVSNVATQVEARTIGAQLRTPSLDPGRPGVWGDYFWGIRSVPSLPYDGSVVAPLDPGPMKAGAGTPPPPLENLPPRKGIDPHTFAAISAAARSMIVDFLRVDGFLGRVCDGKPCYVGAWHGP